MGGPGFKGARSDSATFRWPTVYCSAARWGGQPDCRRGGSASCRWKEGGEVAGPVDDPEHLDAVVNRLVEDDIIADGQVAQARRQLLTQRAHFREGRQLGIAVHDVRRDTVGS